MTTKNGIDRLLGEDFGLSGKRLGLITNHTGLSSALLSSIDILRESFDLRALFGPEHGVRGDIDAGAAVESCRDARTGLPVYSLYGAGQSGESFRPNPAMLEDIDLLLIDIQNIGCRFYTYESTMYNAMEVCAETGKTFVVLDRINPINGVDVEGNIPDPSFRSLIGIGPLPQRHGMTMGELALFFNRECGINCDLKIIPLEGWKRDQFGDETGLLWVNPSPNMPGLDAALLYPGTCFFEGTNVSEGRGTTRPFEQIGAPWLDAAALADALNARRSEFPGLIFRPVFFTPAAGKYQGELCRGVQFHVRERRALRPVQSALMVLEAIREQAGDQFAWRPPVKGRRFIDLLAGTDALRCGSLSVYRESCESGGAVFAEKRREYLLY